jgi:NAD-dependent deacetylase
LHGNIRRAKCFDRGHPAASWNEGDERPPRCAACGSMLRPDVVWFGEMLPEGALESAFDAARECDVLLSVGTSGLVEPAASVPFVALESGAAVIEVNRDATALTPRATFSLRGAAGEILPGLVE